MRLSKAFLSITLGGIQNKVINMKAYIDDTLPS